MKSDIQKAIRKGCIFIYPTDTIYGIGCDATNSLAVRRIRNLKRSKKPFSIIASKEWIRKNCVLGGHERFLRLLPGPYTLILKLKRVDAVSKEVNPNGKTIGVRIPKHPFTKEILKSKRPFITTSVNETGERFITSPGEIPERFKKAATIIDAGKLRGMPSKIYDLTGPRAKRIR
ncbi:MAG TPA: threonylcarbamoyl-AMP synthase [Nanoarchaeota archaeon]|nr:MAG: tRNA threonylcarbamoyladenosine biosynthesis protein [archaeon GW2011_AR6]MBS3082569.1 threonylcarbamoyl-AMP synthase [Candidatus Pacearchaeota archaeon]HIH17470.1 threonylcarbamoyl-AMP synthase [Nanoarchaeota archaeon]HIH33947.1 threonylcarbamoyl-AMP synthase [Nanoarchaeota archaeon]HIH51762.1 threonylcarbamoyl-AMP synthase [Nanoarchaeota archaeon]